MNSSTVEMSKVVWNQLKCSAKELQLKATLTGGQSFRYFEFRFYAKLYEKV